MTNDYVTFVWQQRHSKQPPVITVFIETKELLKLFFCDDMHFCTSFKITKAYFIIEMCRLIATVSLQCH